jgi:hypothetical protein
MPSALLGLRATVKPASSTVTSGATLAITVLFENTTSRALRMTLREPPDVWVYDDALGEKRVDVDDPSRRSVDGDARCDVTPLGVTALNQDPAIVSLAPNGTLTETVLWRAAHARREMRTCGWSYQPLEPGSYRLLILWPESGEHMGTLTVTVVR